MMYSMEIVGDFLETEYFQYERRLRRRVITSYLFKVDDNIIFEIYKSRNRFIITRYSPTILNSRFKTIWRASYAFIGE